VLDVLEGLTSGGAAKECQAGLAAFEPCLSLGPRIPQHVGRPPGYDAVGGRANRGTGPHWAIANRVQPKEQLAIGRRHAPDHPQITCAQRLLPGQLQRLDSRSTDLYFHLQGIPPDLHHVRAGDAAGPGAGDIAAVCV